MIKIISTLTQLITANLLKSTTILLLAGIAFQTPASAWTLTTLYIFSGPDGSNPIDSPMLDATGNLYGVNFMGGSTFGTGCTNGNGCGTVFKLAPPAAGKTAWKQATLVNFTGPNGAWSSGGLVSDAAGNLYGVTGGGGSSYATGCIGGSSCGIVYKLTPPSGKKTAWTQTTLVNFNGINGGWPYGKLVLDSSGNLYGTTWGGGSTFVTGGCNGWGCGTVYKLTPPSGRKTAWTQTTLVNFNVTNGSWPMAGVVRDSAGNLYGTTNHGGIYGSGTVFKLAPPAAGQTAWNLTTLVDFDSLNGSFPQSGLVRDAAGNFYGTTNAPNQGQAYGACDPNAAGGCGTVFKLAPPAAGQATWNLTTLVTFDGMNGASPLYADLTFDSAGNLYGTTNHGGSSDLGTVFQLAPPAAGQTAWNLTTLVDFDSSNGSFPQGGLKSDSAGNLYGTTGGDSGSAHGMGTVFKITP